MNVCTPTHGRTREERTRTRARDSCVQNPGQSDAGWVEDDYDHYTTTTPTAVTSSQACIDACLPPSLGQIVMRVYKNGRERTSWRASERPSEGRDWELGILAGFGACTHKFLLFKPKRHRAWGSRRDIQNTACACNFRRRGFCEWLEKGIPPGKIEHGGGAGNKDSKAVAAMPAHTQPELSVPTNAALSHASSTTTPRTAISYQKRKVINSGGKLRRITVPPLNGRLLKPRKRKQAIFQRE